MAQAVLNSGEFKPLYYQICIYGLSQCNQNIIYKLSFYRVPLKVCVWQHPAMGQLFICLCIRFFKANSAKRLKKIFFLHKPSLPFSLSHAHVHRGKISTPTHKSYMVQVLTFSSSKYLCSTPSWPPFSELLWWKFHNSQEMKLLNTPKGTGVLIWVTVQDHKDLTLCDFNCLLENFQSGMLDFRLRKARSWLIGWKSYTSIFQLIHW
jgi:hypothetical protein